MKTLIGISFSPWTEKARWALDYHNVSYRYQEYIILLGEPKLRRQTKRWTRFVTVPVLLDETRSFCDSFEIARYADTLGNSNSLFSAHSQSSLELWNLESESALQAGRILYLDALSQNRDAKAECLPSFIPSRVRPYSTWLADVGIRFVQWKQSVNPSMLARAKELQIQTLERFDAALKPDREFILDSFSYADIAMAVTLQYISPVSDQYIAVGQANRKLLHQPELACKFGRLIEWRDRLYKKYRCQNTK